MRACLRHAQVSTTVRRLGVRAPEILAVEDLRPLVPVPVIVSRLLPGRCLLPGDCAADVWAGVGRDLARLHAAAPAAASTGLRTFTQHVEVDPATVTEQLRAAGRIAGVTAARLARLRDQLVAHVLPDDRPVLCHGDVHAENVIAHRGRYVGLIDFAGAGWLDAAWDFVGMPLGAVRPALDGYRAAGGATASLVERIAWCRLQVAVQRLAAAARPEEDARRAVARTGALLAGSVVSR